MGKRQGLRLHGVHLRLQRANRYYSHTVLRWNRADQNMLHSHLSASKCLRYLPGLSDSVLHMKTDDSEITWKNWVQSVFQIKEKSKSNNTFCYTRNMTAFLRQ